MAKSAWQNPDNCNGIIVEPEATADNIRIGAIGTAPQAIADHGHWSETKREVLRTKQPSNLRGHTQHGKVAETAIDPLETLGLFGAGQILATLEDRGHIFKYTRSRLQVIQFGLGKPNVPQSYAGLVKEDSYQTIGIAVGQRTQQHGIHDAKNGRVGSHAQSQSQNRNRGKTRILAQQSQSMTHVRTQLTPPAHAHGCPHGIFVRLDSAELNSRLSHRFLLGNAFANKVRSVALKMETHFRFHFTFKPLSLDHPLQPGKESSLKIHICSEVVPRILAINDAMRFHFSVSEWSWRRPAAVRLVELRLAVVVRFPPLADDQALMLQPIERWI